MRTTRSGPFANASPETQFLCCKVVCHSFFLWYSETWKKCEEHLRPQRVKSIIRWYLNNPVTIDYLIIFKWYGTSLNKCRFLNANILCKLDLLILQTCVYYLVLTIFCTMYLLLKMIYWAQLNHLFNISLYVFLTATIYISEFSILSL